MNNVNESGEQNTSNKKEITNDYYVFVPLEENLGKGKTQGEAPFLNTDFNTQAEEYYKQLYNTLIQNKLQNGELPELTKEEKQSLFKKKKDFIANLKDKSKKEIEELKLNKKKEIEELKLKNQLEKEREKEERKKQIEEETKKAKNYLEQLGISEYVREVETKKAIIFTIDFTDLSIVYDKIMNNDICLGGLNIVDYQKLIENFDNISDRTLISFDKRIDNIHKIFKKMYNSICVDCIPYRFILNARNVDYGIEEKINDIIKKFLYRKVNSLSYDNTEDIIKQFNNPDKVNKEYMKNLLNLCGYFDIRSLDKYLIYLIRHFQNLKFNILRDHNKKNPFHSTQSMIYLQGLASSGKTTLIERVICEAHKRLGFYFGKTTPRQDNFTDPVLFQKNNYFIYFEDVGVSKIDPDIWNSFIDNTYVKKEIKGKDAEMVLSNKTFIGQSNELKENSRNQTRMRRICDINMNYSTQEDFCIKESAEQIHSLLNIEEAINSYIFCFLNAPVNYENLKEHTILDNKNAIEVKLNNNYTKLYDIIKDYVFKVNSATGDIVNRTENLTIKELVYLAGNKNLSSSVAEKREEEIVTYLKSLKDEDKKKFYQFRIATSNNAIKRAKFNFSKMVADLKEDVESRNTIKVSFKKEIQEYMEIYEKIINENLYFNNVNDANRIVLIFNEIKNYILSTFKNNNDDDGKNKDKVITNTKTLEEMKAEAKYNKEPIKIYGAKNLYSKPTIIESKEQMKDFEYILLGKAKNDDVLERKDENYKNQFLLLEYDNKTLEEQQEIIKKNILATKYKDNVFSITYSGNKSYHILFNMPYELKVSDDKKELKEYIKWFFKEELKVDDDFDNKVYNSSRLSRMPFGTREDNKKKQICLYLNNYCLELDNYDIFKDYYNKLQKNKEIDDMIKYNALRKQYSLEKDYSDKGTLSPIEYLKKYYSNSNDLGNKVLRYYESGIYENGTAINMLGWVLAKFKEKDISFCEEFYTRLFMEHSSNITQPFHYYLNM